MKVIIMNGVKLRYKGFDDTDKNFKINLYREYLKPIKTLIEASVNNPDSFYIDMALRLKNGEKLEVFSIYQLNKLALFDVDQTYQSPNKKYLKLINSADDSPVFIEVPGYKFKPKFETWYNESKLLNETNFKIVIDDYIRELSNERDKFEDMIIYKKYESPHYYSNDIFNKNIISVGSHKIVENITLYNKTSELHYNEITIDGRDIKITDQCLKYIRGKDYSDEVIKEIIFWDINNRLSDFEIITKNDVFYIDEANRLKSYYKI